MHPTLQMLERHRPELEAVSCHYFDAPDSIPWLSNNSKSFSLNAISTSPLKPKQATWPTAELNVLFYPKAKERLLWWLYQIQQSLSGTQQLWVVGENDGGIKSLAKRLKGMFECEKIDTARHCALFVLTPKPGVTIEDFWTHYQHNELSISALPGVFSAKKLDTGTSVLLEHLPDLKSGDFLEMGCGSGVLAAELLTRYPQAHLDTYDVDLLAVESAQATLNANKLAQRANVYWSADATALPPKTYQAIVTNPPFHKGIRTEYGPTETFFSQASDRLVRGGKLVWVANDFLNYQTIIKAQFKSVTVIAQTKGFKVYEAIK
ncbi:methyltransferase [Reinekea sp.]|jgi:16S rRNA (guanine1207-N2)-methyltransferase|uniref:methyltransferase n=2 Tax=Reinekea sp. TaxID=1970455 RepID=UPI00398985C6